MNYYIIDFSWDNGSTCTCQGREIVEAKNDEDAIKVLKKGCKVTWIHNVSQSTQLAFDQQNQTRADHLRWNKILKES